MRLAALYPVLRFALCILSVAALIEPVRNAL